MILFIALGDTVGPANVHIGLLAFVRNLCRRYFDFPATFDSGQAFLGRVSAAQVVEC